MISIFFFVADNYHVLLAIPCLLFVFNPLPILINHNHFQWLWWICNIVCWFNERCKWYWWEGDYFDGLQLDDKLWQHVVAGMYYILNYDEICVVTMGLILHISRYN